MKEGKLPAERDWEGSARETDILNICLFRCWYLLCIFQLF